MKKRDGWNALSFFLSVPHLPPSLKVKLSEPLPATSWAGAPLPREGIIQMI